MKNLFIIVFAFIIVLWGMGISNAKLISIDKNSLNDGLITLDTSTGLEWLDVLETQGMSYDDVLSDQSIQFDGWRHATGLEVGDLFGYIDIPEGPTGSASGSSTTIDPDLTNIDEILGYLGVTTLPPDENFYQSHGFLSDNGTEITGDAIIRITDAGGAFLRSDSFNFNTGWLWRQYHGPWDSNAREPKVGHWLVRQTSTPNSEPVMSKIVPSQGDYGTNITLFGFGFGAQQSGMVNANQGFYSFVRFIGTDTMYFTTYKSWSGSELNVKIEELFIDVNGNHIQDAGESFLSPYDIPYGNYGITVGIIWFDDTNSNGIYDAGDSVSDFFPSNNITFSLICADNDADGVCDDNDNCPEISNPDQTDTDEDGTGDVCDSCTDTDGDGYGNTGFLTNTCPDDSCPNQDSIGFDANGDGCIDSLRSLSTQIQTLIDEGVVEEQMQNSLVSKIANASKSVDKENICAAINQVNAQKGNKISVIAAEQIISYAESVINWYIHQIAELENC